MMNLFFLVSILTSLITISSPLNGKVKGVSSSDHQRSGYFEIELSSYKEEQMYGDITIASGKARDKSAKKSYRVIFDTGSNIVWVRANNTDSSLIQVSSHIRKSTYNVIYRTGSVKIRTNIGTVSLKAEDQNFDLQDMRFGISVSEDSKVFDGVISQYL